MEEEKSIGTIQIADSVVASIAGIAALEAEGVSRLAGNITKDQVAKAGKKKLSGAVACEIIEKTVSVRIALLMEYGSSLKKVSAEVQSKVKQAIENMTGLSVTSVGVRVLGIVVSDK